MAVAMVDAVAVTKGERGREQVSSSVCFLCPTPSTKTLSVYSISLKIEGGREAHATTLTQTRRPRQNGVRERAATSGAAERDSGASARQEAEHGYRRGRIYLARASLPGRTRDTITGEVTEAAVASTDIVARTTKGMSLEMPWARKVSFFIDVFYYHDAILMPSSSRLFPPLPSNTAAAGGSGRCFVARWLRSLTWQRTRPWL